MKLKDKEAWDKWVAVNTDPYGGACIKVANLRARAQALG